MELVLVEWEILRESKSGKMGLEYLQNPMDLQVDNDTYPCVAGV